MCPAPPAYEPHWCDLRALCVLAALVLIPAVGWAQPTPSVQVGYEVGSSVFISRLQVDDENARVLTEQEMTVRTEGRSVQVSLPLVLGKKRTHLQTHLGAGQVRFDYASRTRPAQQTEEAYLAHLTLQVQHRLSDRWLLLGEVAPTMVSGLHGPLLPANLTVQGGAVALRQVAPRRAVGLGVAYSTAFGAPVPMPVVMLRARGALWEGGPSWRGRALLPCNLEVWTTMSERAEIGMQARILGSRHHLGTEAPLLDKPFAEAIHVVVGPSAHLQLTSQTTIGIESGLSLFRRMHGSGGQEEMLQLRPEQNGFLRLRFTVAR